MLRRASRGGALFALVLYAAFAAAPRPAGAQGAAPTLAHAINIAGRQRMLAERIVKAWCLLGLGTENRHPRAQLFESIEQFEEQLAVLDGFVRSDAPMRAAFDALRARWKILEPIASAEPDRARAQDLLGAGNAVVGAADGLVRALATRGGDGPGAMIERAGRQRMLTQRLVKTYAYLAWGFDQPQIFDQFVEAWNGFEQTLGQMQAFPGNTPAIERALDEANDEWQWFKSALGMHREQVYFPSIIDDAGEKILVQMERVTLLYQGLLGPAAGR